MQPKSAYAPNRHKYTVDTRAAERVKRAHAPTHARSIVACTVFHVESIELHLMTNARLYTRTQNTRKHTNVNAHFLHACVYVCCTRLHRISHTRAHSWS